jgi:T6SS, Phospholipase effector Tle1-like, catalytic domain
VKFAPEADPKRPWRTLTLSFGRMSFEDKTLNDNVRYARHAISIDENRAAFARVGWGDPHGARPDKDADGFCTFEQFWFAGNHSDIGGSYAENESRLSDISLSWVADAATTIREGIKIDRSVLQLYPCADGMQHDERKVGFPLLTSWLRLTWQGTQRQIGDPNAPLHDTVYRRFALPGVIHYDSVHPYRPEGLRGHAKLADYYKDIPVPPEQSGVLRYIKSFFLPR